MTRATFRSIFGLGLRTIWRVIKWTFILTLPLTASSLLNGLINGILFSLWMPEQVINNTNALIKDWTALSKDWGAEGFTFREFQNTRNDFHIRRLNPNDWVARLEFSHPDQYIPGSHMEMSTNGIDTFADFDTLMYDSKRACKPPPKHQWVYITDYAFPDYNEWDSAFDAAIRAGYASKPINDTRLFYIECGTTGEFYCGVWNVKAPALLHFTIGDTEAQAADIDDGLTYMQSLLGVYPVTARVIEFPLKDAYTGLASSVFPSPEAQMLAIMRDEGLYEQFEPHDTTVQMLLRFWDYLDTFYERKGHVLNYLGEANDWFEKRVVKPLGLKFVDQVIFEVTFFGTHFISSMLLIPCHALKEIVLGFLGTSRYDFTGSKEEDLSESIIQPIADMFDMKKMLALFLQNVTEELKIEGKKIFAEKGTTAAWPRWESQTTDESAPSKTG